MTTTETCEACGRVVDAKEAVRAELSVMDICPTPMTFHPECYEKASQLWKPDPDSTCVVDPLFPETEQWTPRSTRRSS